MNNTEKVSTAEALKILSAENDEPLRKPLMAATQDLFEAMEDPKCIFTAHARRSIEQVIADMQKIFNSNPGWKKGKLP